MTEVRSRIVRSLSAGRIRDLDEVFLARRDSGHLDLWARQRSHCTPATGVGSVRVARPEQPREGLELFAWSRHGLPNPRNDRINCPTLRTQRRHGDRPNLLSAVNLPRHDVQVDGGRVSIWGSRAGPSAAGGRSGTATPQAPSHSGEVSLRGRRCQRQLPQFGMANRTRGFPPEGLRRAWTRASWPLSLNFKLRVLIAPEGKPVKTRKTCQAALVEVLAQKKARSTNWNGHIMTKPISTIEQGLPITESGSSLLTRCATSHRGPRPRSTRT